MIVTYFSTDDASILITAQNTHIALDHKKNALRFNHIHKMFNNTIIILKKNKNEKKTKKYICNLSNIWRK